MYSCNRDPGPVQSRYQNSSEFPSPLFFQHVVKYSMNDVLMIMKSQVKWHLSSGGEEAKKQGNFLF